MTFKPKSSRSKASKASAYKPTARKEFEKGFARQSGMILAKVLGLLLTLGIEMLCAYYGITPTTF